MLTYDYSASSKKANLEEEDIGLQELVIADYVVFLFALDTFMRYLDESGDPNPEGSQTLQKGLTLLRFAERQNLDVITSFIKSNLVSKASISLLEAAMRPPPTPKGASVRALKLRTVLSKGGTTTTKAVFGTSTKARREVQEAIEASMIEDADAALNKFSALVLKNKRLEAWIDEASAVVQPGTAIINPVQEATKGATDATAKLLGDRVRQDGGDLASERAVEAADTRAERLSEIEVAATETAKKAIVKSGEEDKPLTRSEVIGVAAATAAAVTSDSDNPQNVPEPLRKLDDEQRAAALTDGRVGVFAGAGSGKSTTLVARVDYLVNDRRVNPSRVLVTSFNNKAASELKEKIGRSAGADALQQMSVGTMHSLFRRFVSEFGTGSEKNSLGAGFVQGGEKIAYAVQKIWEDCYKEKLGPAPKLKTAVMNKTKWSGNDISPQQAAAEATTQEEVLTAQWYEIYEGLKGVTPNWKPPCQTKAYEAFMAKFRSNGQRLGDFTDMLKMYRDILKRDPAVRRKVQGMFDHIIVDEAQDRNGLMVDIIDMMSEHITDGADGKSVWIVGDDKQAINSFQGAKASLFKEIFEKEGWKTRVIRTNYRCEPEIVDAANNLISHNEGNVPIPQVPAPDRKRGVGSIKVSRPADEADAAISTISEIKQDQILGGDLTDNAVLCRTNKELNSYETACIIRGIPYARRGSGSFLGSPETAAVLGYVQLVTGTDFEKAQKSLGAVINNPNRFFLSDPKKAPEAVEECFSQYARIKGTSAKSINPLAALEDITFVRILATALAKLTRTGKGYKFEEKVKDLLYTLQDMKVRTSDPDYKTTDLFDDILEIKGVTFEDGQVVDQTFRESLKTNLRNAMGGDEPDDDNEDEEKDETKGLGNVSFLYQLAEPDPTDEGDSLSPPTTPVGFANKMSRYATRMRDLRTDTDKWNKEQEALPPEQRRRPPGVYVGTVHSVKGAQWKNVYVQMPKGKFPIEFKPKPGDPPPDPVKEQERWEDERRLGYVALTRAAKNLRIVCPNSLGGKPAGISSFVYEAGLKPGENIQNDSEDEDGTPKTASHGDWAVSAFQDMGPDPEEGPEGYSYDFSGGAS